MHVERQVPTWPVLTFGGDVQPGRTVEQAAPAPIGVGAALGATTIRRRTPLPQITVAPVIALHAFGRAHPLVHGLTRDLRVQWALEELELPYDVHGLDHTGGETSRDEFQCISPFKQIPVIEDRRSGGRRGRGGWCRGRSTRATSRIRGAALTRSG